ncbi:MAG: response regulator [Gammaproteobacteria bacterium]|nr:response regulator [Gammaproteobacteria bacterium]
MSSIGLDLVNTLLVEPSTTQQKLISGYLQVSGIQLIEHAGTGAQALASMRSNVPDLVISAMYFDDMDGVRLLETMRHDPQLRDVPFILISSETSLKMLDPIRQGGVIAILTKPFSQQSMHRALLSTLDFLNPEKLDLDQGGFAEELKVLIVDDSVTARHHIRNTLNALGIEDITEAANGREAIGQITTNYFDFIVTDYNMPEMDGRELIEFIRTKSSQPTLPILMVTSESDMRRLAAVEQGGASAICDKPFEINMVRSLIKKLIK